MKFIFSIIIFIFIFGCSNTHQVYWCGDHKCVNKKEKEEYFKKTMTVEIRETKNNKKKGLSEVEKILQQAKPKQKKLSKYEKKKEIDLLKKQKDKIQEKKIENEINEAVSNTSADKDDVVELKDDVVELKDEQFKFVVDKILNRNKSKEYPNINNTPN